MKKMKLKKRRKFKFRILLYVFLVFIGYQLSYNLIMDFKLEKSNEGFVKALLMDSNYHLLYEKKANNLFNRLFTSLFNVNEPVSILENTFHFKANKILNASYVSNPKTDDVNNKDPLVYIYNSHQSEKYQGEALKQYNITPGVMMASYILEERLEKDNINTQVLEDNLIDYMNLNNMNHASSYKASRYFISKTITSNPTLKLIIDLHRDSIAKDKSTVVINNKSCAKIVFVVGNEYDNYEKNLNMTNKLNSMIKEKYPTLTRGVLIKGGDGNNGVYNQDISDKMTLMELGTDSNTVDEVLNTIDLIYPIIGEYVNGS